MQTKIKVTSEFVESLFDRWHEKRNTLSPDLAKAEALALIADAIYALANTVQRKG